MKTARIVRGRPSLSLRLGSSMPYLQSKAISITPVRVWCQSCASGGWHVLERSAEVCKEYVMGDAHLTAISREGSAMMGKSMVTCVCQQMHVPRAWPSVPAACGDSKEPTQDMRCEQSTQHPAARRSTCGSPRVHSVPPHHPATYYGSPPAGLTLKSDNCNVEACHLQHLCCLPEMLSAAWRGGVCFNIAVMLHDMGAHLDISMKAVWQR